MIVFDFIAYLCQVNLSFNSKKSFVMNMLP